MPFITEFKTFFLLLVQQSGFDFDSPSSKTVLFIVKIYIALLGCTFI